MRRLALVAVFALACGALPARAQALSLAYKSGDTYKYKFDTASKQTMVAGGLNVPTDVEMTADETVTVKSVDSSGTADLSITLGNLVMKTTSAGITTTMTGIPDSTVDARVAADGRLISSDGNQFGTASPFLAFTGLSGGFVSAVLPANAVKPGDTWSKSYDQAIPDGSGGIHISSTSTYVRDESVSGVGAAVVETKSTGTMDVALGSSSSAGAQPSPSPLPGTATIPGQGMAIKATITSDVTTWIEPGAHRILKSHSTEKESGTMTIDLPGVTIPGMTGPMTMSGVFTTDMNSA
ncbi:MAG TPA: hypothetical protein VMW11_01075 [Candidatus Dormibacteraeota bacterium]|nr:hypothetical protein [Candidatus Dormibacteraeota bacterium]